jgi:hypothetical protein
MMFTGKKYTKKSSNSDESVSESIKTKQYIGYITWDSRNLGQPTVTRASKKKLGKSREYPTSYN